MIVGRYCWHVAVLCVATLAVWFFAIDRRLTNEAVLALANSDRAFDDGRLRVSLQGAHRASMAYVPGSPLVDRGTARLRAIAVGSEATGRRRNALLAWSALAVTSFNTPYHALGPIMAREATQHVEALLPKRSDTREVVENRWAGATASTSSLPVRRSLSFLISLALVVVLVVGVWPGRYLEVRNVLVRRLGLIVIGVAAALCWGIGWVFV